MVHWLAASFAMGTHVLCTFVTGTMACGIVEEVRLVVCQEPLARASDEDSIEAVAPGGIGSEPARGPDEDPEEAATTWLADGPSDGMWGAIDDTIGGPTGWASDCAETVGACTALDAPSKLERRVPACTALGPMGREEQSSSLKNSSVVGSKGVVDISENGNMFSSKTTCREMMIRLEWRSRHLYPL